MIEETYIHPTAVIDDCVSIGKKCRIDALALLGFGGLVGNRDRHGKVTRVMSHGKLIIEDGVWVGAGTMIQSGHHADTIIGEGSMIDIDVHIGHDCVLAKNVMIAASTTLAGCIKIGDNSWLGLGCIIRDGITIGKNVVVGMGAVVTKDVPDHWTVVGNPATRLEIFKEQRKKLAAISHFPLKARIIARLKPIWRKVKVLIPFRYRIRAFIVKRRKNKE